MPTCTLRWHLVRISSTLSASNSNWPGQLHDIKIGYIRMQGQVCSGALVQQV